MGWQMFSLTNFSTLKQSLGNSLAIHKGEEICMYSSMCHKIIFSYKGLIDFCKTIGFKNIKVKGAGYHPLPAFVGNLDKRHCHFITIKAIK